VVEHLVVKRLAHCGLKEKLAEHACSGFVANMPMVNSMKKGGDTEREKKGGKL
jgi:hypothetical protein